VELQKKQEILLEVNSQQINTAIPTPQQQQQQQQQQKEKMA
jgi:hypothetical protein